MLRHWLAITLFPGLLLSGCSDSSSGGSGSGSGGGLPPPAGAGALTQFRFVDQQSPQRDYYVYVPRSLPSSPVPLVVYLHGCNQTATDAAIGTRWSETAESRRLIVVYPEQAGAALAEEDAGQPDQFLLDGNGSGCWNWFRPDQIQRDGGEAATIAGITREVMARTDIRVDPNRIYVMGASAGANMAAVMGATYPDIYAAIGMFAGCGYPLCTDPSGALAYTAMGENARRLPVTIFHGSLDPAVPLALGRQGLQQWLGTNDLVDDGISNLSVSPLPAQVFTLGLDPSLLSNIGDEGDPCIGDSNTPCVGGILGLQQNYPFTLERYVDANNCPLIDFWTIHGLGHNYPGGNTEGSFTDPLGPNITAAALSFFLGQPMNGAFESGQLSCNTPSLLENPPLPLPLPLPLP